MQSLKIKNRTFLKAGDIAINVGRCSIHTNSVLKKNIIWQHAFIVDRKGILHENVKKTKKVFIEKEDHVSDVGQFGTL